MDIKKYIKRLAISEPLKRREMMETVLKEEGVYYTKQTAEASYKNALGVQNFIIPPREEAPYLLLCAHYDSYLGSTGTNDNLSSVAILLALLKSLDAFDWNISIAFFDGEESGQFGSKLYLKEAVRENIQGVINLDLCGFGDSLVIYGRGYEKKEPFLPFSNKQILEKYNGHLVTYLPKGDDVTFSKAKLKTLSIARVPFSDIQFLKTLSLYSDHMIGRPPEYQMMLEQMEITTTMHGGYRDKIDFIEEESLLAVYEYLTDGLLGTYNDKKKASSSDGLLSKLFGKTRS